MRNLFVSALALLILSFGCLAPNEVSSPINSVKPIDKGVLTTVQINLKSDPALASSNIQVAAENNLVVLRGTVPSEEAKAKAEEIAKKVDRVEKVANHLEVKPQ